MKVYSHWEHDELMSELHRRWFKTKADADVRARVAMATGLSVLNPHPWPAITTAAELAKFLNDLESRRGTPAGFLDEPEAGA